MRCRVKLQEKDYISHYHSSLATGILDLFASREMGGEGMSWLRAKGRLGGPKDCWLEAALPAGPGGAFHPVCERVDPSSSAFKCTPHPVPLPFGLF